MENHQAYQEAVKQVDFVSFEIYNVAYRIDEWRQKICLIIFLEELFIL